MNGAMNIPNLLTILRILLAPLFILLVASGAPYKAALVMVIAGATDMLDGYLARRLSLETPIGAALDGLADKLFLSSAFLALAVTGLIPWWLALVVITKDVIILGTVFYLKFAGRPADTTPTILGKLSTFTQVTALFTTLLTGVAYSLLSFAVVFFILSSSLEYAARELTRRLRSEPNGTHELTKTMIR